MRQFRSRSDVSNRYALAMKAREDEKFQTLLKAQDALRDILFMYRELANWRGLWDDFGWEDGKFEPLEWIDFPADGADLDTEDLRLLHEGSALKLICHMLQSWGQGGYPTLETAYIGQIRHAVTSGRLNHLPELKDVLSDSFTSDAALKERAEEIYDRYVVGYFHRLLGKA